MPPKKKNIDEADEMFDNQDTVIEASETVKAALKDNEKPRSLEFFQVVEGFSRSMYYRLQYEIRPNPSKRMTLTEWRKLLEKVKKDDIK